MKMAVYDLTVIIVNASATFSSQKLNRDDALATLNAFMLDVQEATSVAKQQEDEKKKGKRIDLSRQINLEDFFQEGRGTTSLLSEIPMIDLSSDCFDVSLAICGKVENCGH